MPVERTADGGNRLAITVCVILATLMQALDTTIANVAPPYMQGSVSATQDQIDWVLTSYIVAAAPRATPMRSWTGSGFGTLSLGIGALQVLLDRGEHAAQHRGDGEASDGDEEEPLEAEAADEKAGRRRHDR
jgi:hypothetical protein